MLLLPFDIIDDIVYIIFGIWKTPGTILPTVPFCQYWILFNRQARLSLYVFDKIWNRNRWRNRHTDMNMVGHSAYSENRCSIFFHYWKQQRIYPSLIGKINCRFASFCGKHNVVIESYKAHRIDFRQRYQIISELTNLLRWFFQNHKSLTHLPRVSLRSALGYRLMFPYGNLDTYSIFHIIYIVSIYSQFSRFSGIFFIKSKYLIIFGPINYTIIRFWINIVQNFCVIHINYRLLQITFWLPCVIFIPKLSWTLH